MVSRHSAWPPRHSLSYRAGRTVSYIATAGFPQGHNSSKARRCGAYPTRMSAHTRAGLPHCSSATGASIAAVTTVSDIDSVGQHAVTATSARPGIAVSAYVSGTERLVGSSLSCEVHAVVYRSEFACLHARSSTRAGNQARSIFQRELDWRRPHLLGIFVVSMLA